MKKIISSIILAFAIITSASATTYYVNGKTGCDTTKKFDGRTEKTAFKTIQKAINSIRNGDKIFVEGDGIVYSERIIIEGKEDIKLIGRNNPVISGMVFSSISDMNAGIYINSSLLTIEGMIIEGFNHGELKTAGLKGGAGIYVDSDVTDIVIKDCMVRDCNYGIVLYEVEASQVTNCKILNITKTQDGSAGNGIFVLSNKHFLQNVQIGTAKGNSIENCDGYGIYFGSLGSVDSPILSDLSKISNNTITGCGKAGICVSNVAGMFKVKNNTIGNSANSIELRGLMLDMLVEKNNFGPLSHGASTYLLSDKDYDGSMLYDIWKNNDNRFKEASFAAIDPKRIMVMVAPDGSKHVRNNEKDAVSDSQGKGKIESLK